MAKTFWDYLSKEKKERYKYLLNDKERFEDFNDGLLSFVLGFGNACMFKGCETYEDAEKYNTVEEISRIVNTQIYPEMPTRELIENMPPISEAEFETTF